MKFTHEYLLNRLTHAVENYLDKRPDDEQGTVAEWSAFRSVEEELQEAIVKAKQTLGEAYYAFEK